MFNVDPKLSIRSVASIYPPPCFGWWQNKDLNARFPQFFFKDLIFGVCIVIIFLPKNILGLRPRWWENKGVK